MAQHFRQAQTSQVGTSSARLACPNSGQLPVSLHWANRSLGVSLFFHDGLTIFLLYTYQQSTINRVQDPREKRSLLLVTSFAACFVGSRSPMSMGAHVHGANSAMSPAGANHTQKKSLRVNVTSKQGASQPPRLQLSGGQRGSN